MAVNVVFFSFSRDCSTGGPGAHSAGWWLSLHASYQQLLCIPTQSGAPSPFGLVWLSLPHPVYKLRPISNCLDFWCWLSYIMVQRPLSRSTRSLEWHVWSSSSGNNCHAVHSSLSSGASVYECTIGCSSPRPISSANFRPRGFLSHNWH